VAEALGSAPKTVRDIVHGCRRPDVAYSSRRRIEVPRTEALLLLALALLSKAKVASVRESTRKAVDGGRQPHHEVEEGATTMTARKRDHVHQAANGTWSFVIDAPSASARRRQLYRRGFATKKAALAALDKLRTDLARGVFVEPSKLTVGVYLSDQWLPIAESRVRPTTAASYRMIVRRWIVPTIGAVPLQLLDRARVARWVVELSQAGLAAKSVRNVHVVLRKALADALELGLVQRNAAEKTKTLPKRPAPSPRAWSVEQLVRFLEGTVDDRLAPVWRFLATTGCRRGEVLGLRWADVDLDHAGVTIMNQRTVADGHVVEGPVKTTSGARTIALDSQTIAVLRSWRKVQTAERLVLGRRLARHRARVHQRRRERHLAATPHLRLQGVVRAARAPGDRRARPAPHGGHMADLDR
jgi:integrase